MVSDKFIALIQKVEERTKRGELNWEATADDHIFQASLAKFILSVAEEPARNSPEPDYRLSIVDGQGRTIESASNADFSGNQMLSDVHPYVVLQEIFRGARRTALGADRAVESLLSELEGALRILSAKYGARGLFNDVARLLQEKIVGGRLEVVVDNGNMGGDPAEGVGKQLTVEYSHSGERLSKTVKEHDTLTLP